MGKYSLTKSRRILRTCFNFYRRKWKKLSATDLQTIEDRLSRLDQASLSGDKAAADALARQVETLGTQMFKKSLWDYIRDVGLALVFALVLAVVVRQMWFEPMEIPSGSMRPTFQELDRLIATKTPFGINIPLTTGHFFFQPEHVKRTGVVIFTSQDMDIPDQDTTYFYLFPAKRRLIKRLMGKPGDALYFYGGKVWGVGADGEDLKVLREAPWMEGIDAVPYISFGGKVTTPVLTNRNLYSPAFLHQFNQEIARLTYLPDGSIRGELFDGTDWVADQPGVEDDSTVHTYGQIYGMRNYAMARLLTQEEVIRLSEQLPEQKAPLYLELRHNPSLSYPKPHIGRDMYGRHRPMLTPEVSIIPLNQNHLDKIRGAMTTSRFIVKDGKATPDRADVASLGPYRPSFPNVPNGRYQIQNGIAYKVAWGGVLKKLPLDHPLYDRSVRNIQRLFNIGIEFNTLFEPHLRNQTLFPSRYAYFNQGALYVMGSPVFAADDATLLAFNAKEETRKTEAPSSRPYTPFKDWGPPINEDGILDAEFIRKFGLTLPEKSYLALGDNFASSADSREFGFLPEANLRGAPLTIIWPPGKRWGAPAHATGPSITASRIIIWSVALLCVIIFYTLRHLRSKRPVFQKLS